MKRIGRYEVVRELRGGGMGTVTLGKSPDGQLVVLKRPHSVDLDAAVRLRDEARIGARLLHPAVVDTLDLFELDTGVPVLVVAYVDGPSLEVLRPLGPLPTSVIARIGRQIAEGLAALHESTDENGRPLHILHRDVTPGNIVVAKDGDAKLIDLGIARFSERQAEHTQDGFLRGTMRYLAPELLQGDTYSTASDLWSLGMVLWEAAIGRFAYRGETDREVLAGILRGEPMELDDGEHVDEALVDVIRPLLQLSPVARVSTGAEAAARFAALEARYDDTGALTRETVAAALERKVLLDAEHKARLAEKLRPENLGFASPVRGPLVGELFADEETAAEVEAYRAGSPAPADGPFDAMPATEPLSDEEMPRPRFVEHGEKTINVPAPVSFLVAPPDRATGDASEEPAAEDDLDATTPMPTLPVPAEALRSDDVDLPERAREFDSGELMPPPVPRRPRPVTLTTDEDDDSPTMVTPIPAEVAARRREERAAQRGNEPAKPPAREPSSPWPTAIATAAPAPELDDDELDEARTLGGLSPAKPSPSKVVAPPVPPPAEAPKPLARIALARKTPAQIEAERAAKAGRPSIDALPPARPKPREPEPVVEARRSWPPVQKREERGFEDEVTTLSPFDLGSSEELVESESGPAEAAPDGKSVRGRKKKKRAGKGKRGKRSAQKGTDVDAAPVVAAPVAPPAEPLVALVVEPTDVAAAPAEAPEPTQVSASPMADDLPSSMFGARLVELPPPRPPVLPSPAFSRVTVAEAPPAATAAQPPETSAHADAAPPQERAAGEVMKLSDVVAFLEDD